MPPAVLPPTVADVERWLEAIYVAAEGAALRREDRRKALEVTALLAEIARAVEHESRKRVFTLVDAAAGKAYLGLLAAKLVFERAGVEARVVTIEREHGRLVAGRTALARLDTRVPVECRHADVSDPAAWPEHPSLVVALHACGAAADVVIDRTVACGARALLLVPCCTGAGVTAAALAEGAAARFHVPRHAPVRRRFVQAVVDAERTWRLEAGGYETEVVEFVGALITPHNLLWRARRVGEPVRTARARQALDQWHGLFGAR